MSLRCQHTGNTTVQVLVVRNGWGQDTSFTISIALKHHCLTQLIFSPYKVKALILMYISNCFYYTSVWILFPLPWLSQIFLMEKRFDSESPPWHELLLDRILSQKIYISTICNVRLMLERIAVVRWTPVLCLPPPPIHYDRCIIIYKSHLKVVLANKRHVNNILL